MKSPPANPCVIAHFIGRGACVYCRLLSVLLMQIIKFGGKLVVNPHCFCIERHDFKRNKANFRILLVDGLHCGEQQNIADGGAVGQEHDETVNAEAEAARGGQAVFQSGNIVVINLGFAVGLDGLALSNLALKTCFLVDGVIQLAECVAILGAVNEILKPLSKRRVIGLRLASGLISTG